MVKKILLSVQRPKSPQIARYSNGHRQRQRHSKVFARSEKEMRDQETEYATALARDQARNESELARVAAEASADYQHPVDHAAVRNARLARLSVAHGCAGPT